LGIDFRLILLLEERRALRLRELLRHENRVSLGFNRFALATFCELESSHNSAVQSHRVPCQTQMLYKRSSSSIGPTHAHTSVWRAEAPARMKIKREGSHRVRRHAKRERPSPLLLQEHQELAPTFSGLHPLLPVASWKRSTRGDASADKGETKGEHMKKMSQQPV
jgi:hypothetical protein